MFELEDIYVSRLANSDFKQNWSDPIYILWVLKLPSVSYVQVEPIVVQIDRLDLVLEENDDVNVSNNSSRYIN